MSVTRSLLDGLREGYWVWNRQRVPLTKLRLPLLRALAHRARRYGANPCTSFAEMEHEIFAILKAELDRRGEPVDENRYMALAHGDGAPCECCDKPALYVVGHKGYCRLHKGRALLLQRAKRYRLKQRDRVFDANRTKKPNYRLTKKGWKAR